jgi:hypothetical protein
VHELIPSWISVMDGGGEGGMTDVRDGDGQ